MVYTIKESFQVTINSPAIALPYCVLCVAHGLVCISIGSKTITLVMEIRVPFFLQHLSNGLLYKSIQYSRDAQLALTTIWLWDFNTPHRLRFIVPVDELLPNLRPVLFKMIREVIDTHAVDARSTFIAANLFQRAQ